MKRIDDCINRRYCEKSAAILHNCDVKWVNHKCLCDSRICCPFESDLPASSCLDFEDDIEEVDG